MAPPLLAWFEESRLEAGVDEAGRGALAGPVYAAAVVWNPCASLSRDELRLIRDSKTLSRAQRQTARSIIEASAVAYSVASASAQEVDQMNVFHATQTAMHRALDGLGVEVDAILVDGDRFRPYLALRDAELVPHTCIVDGDNKYLSIAAASIMAKTHRDELMAGAVEEMHPGYGFAIHSGYGTARHMQALKSLGPCHEHRVSFAPVRKELR